MDVFEKARNLGRAIARSQEYQNLIACQNAVLQSRIAVELLRKFEEKKSEIKYLQANNMEIPDEILQDMEMLQQEVLSNTSIQDLISAQKDYDNLLRRINDEVARAISQG